MKTVKIDKEDLKTLDLVSNGVSTNLGGRKSLLNVNLENGLIVSCDGHLLRVEKLESLLELWGQIPLVSIKKAKELAKGAKGQSFVELEIDDKPEENYPQWRNTLAPIEAYSGDCLPFFGGDVMKKLYSTFPKNAILQFRPQIGSGADKKSILVVSWYGGKLIGSGVIMSIQNFIEVEDVIWESPLFSK